MVSEGAVCCVSDGMVEQRRLLRWKHVVQAIHVKDKKAKRE